ncbi:unnamed protein product [Adineta ricciae]|uniref:Uncharacterized protein n=1 Tax=Adineta ricciae TaxID=249248 RepID=A0A815W648_ADIRI|nr:unnamed protein product [Adineta ricciae]CAF1620819.1 unnamed protein product [Adineta ricciae]
MLSIIKLFRRKKSLQFREQTNQPVIELIHRNFTNNSGNTFTATVLNNLPEIIPNKTKHRVTLVWFDPNCSNDDTIVDVRVSKQTLAAAITDASFICFSNKDECVSFLREHQDTAEIIFLIVSGQSSIDLLDDVDLSLTKPVDSIFIFCLRKEIYEPLLLYRKQIVGIYQEHNELIEAIQHQIRALSQRDLIVTFQKENGKNGYLVPLEVQAKLIWMRLLKETLLLIPQTDARIKMMHNRFFIMYRNDPASLQQINNFIDNYQPEDAIPWYTKDCFLFRHINSAMRTENINEIFVCLPYIADLCEAIQIMKNSVFDATIFYRGCVLYNEEITGYRDNVGSLMGINTFFSASRDREISKIFAGCGSLEQNTALISVIFEIHVDQNSSTVFTDISTLSNHPEENEVLFDWNSIFRIRSVIYNDNDKCWIVDLITDYEVQLEIEEMYQQLNDTNTSNQPSLSIIQHLISMGEYKQAYDYSTLLLEENLWDPLFLSYHAQVCYYECDYNTAVKYLKTAESMIDDSGSFENRICSTTILSIMSDILKSLGENTLAEQYKNSILSDIKSTFYSMRLTTPIQKFIPMFMEESNPLLNSKSRVELVSKLQDISRYRSLPVILTEYAYNLLLDGKYDESLIELQKAELEAVKLITADSPFRFHLHMLFSSTYIHLNNLNKAKEHLDISYKILANNNSRSSPSLLTSYHILFALVCLLNDQDQQVLDLQLSRARTAFLKTNGFINMYMIPLALWNICHLHKQLVKRSRNQINRVQLEKLMEESFKLCEFDKILYGKSNDNVHRHLFDYAQQIKSTRFQSIE